MTCVAAPRHFDETVAALAETATDMNAK